MAIVIGSGRPLAHKNLATFGGNTLNPFDYGAELGDFALVVAVHTQPFTYVASAPPVPSGWSLFKELHGGRYDFDYGGGGSIQLIYKRLTADDDKSIQVDPISSSTGGVVHLLKGGRRPPVTTKGGRYNGMFVGYVPPISINPAVTTPPCLAVGCAITNGGSSASSPALTTVIIGAIGAHAAYRYRLFAGTELPLGYTFSVASGSNYAGHFACYFEG